MDIGPNGTVYAVGQATSAPWGAQVLRYVGNQQWTTVGKPISTTTVQDIVSFAVAPNGRLYCGYRTDANQLRAEVKRLDAASGDWLPVGTLPIPAPNPANGIQLVFDANSRPLLAYETYANPPGYNIIHVKHAVPTSPP
jgi:hypothetical protein